MIALVDYGMGNLRSVANAFAAIGRPVRVTDDPDDLRRADGIVLPGVGAFADGMRNLEQRGLLGALAEAVQGRGVPYLGICLGMQFLAEKSFEWGAHPGLGWVPGVVRRIEPTDRRVKVPHIGWNALTLTRPGRLYEGLDEPPVYYFVHGYHLAVAAEAAGVVTATCEHGETLVASVEQGHVFGVQFHPEKSQRVGLRLLENFARVIEARRA